MNVALDQMNVLTKETSQKKPTHHVHFERLNLNSKWWHVAVIFFFKISLFALETKIMPGFRNNHFSYKVKT